MLFAARYLSLAYTLIRLTKLVILEENGPCSMALRNISSEFTNNTSRISYQFETKLHTVAFCNHKRGTNI